MTTPMQIDQRDREARDHFRRQVTDEQARQAAKNFIDAHCRNEGGKGVQMSIPARADDDDLLLVDYIRQQARHRTADTARIAELEKALRDMRDHYISLADSGDCGFWNPREEPVVIAATTALGGQP